MGRNTSITGKKGFIPSHQDMKKPLVALLKRKGEVSLEEALAYIAKKFSLSVSAQNRKQDCGRETVFQNRLRWARWELKSEGKIETTGRGRFRLVESGTVKCAVLSPSVSLPNTTPPALNRYRVVHTQRVQYTVDVLAPDEEQAEEFAEESDKHGEPYYFGGETDVTRIDDTDPDFHPVNAAGESTTNATAPAHTPGPWHTDSMGTDRVWILDSEGNYLAEIVAKDECGFAAPTDQQLANAHLMAAAPDLLVACIQACNFLSDKEDDLSGVLFELLSHAINKAKGH